ncbi:MAG: VPLPA-CTERM sorting domain-containing protein [Chromatiales bacterium]|nr:VPLPA-CTERM sorting domain-containing protein [Chromatiales bacterium]
MTAFIGGAASAATVTYNWVPNAGQFGSGSLTFTDPGIVDPANFTVPVGALVGLSYTWNNGVSINLASVTTITAANFQAGCGYLISAFNMSAATPDQFQLANSAGSCFPNFFGPGLDFVLPGAASNNLQSNGIYPSEINAGTWQLAPAVVPVPAAAWLMGSGVAVLVGLRRRKTA